MDSDPFAAIFNENANATEATPTPPAPADGGSGDMFGGCGDMFAAFNNASQPTAAASQDMFAAPASAGGGEDLFAAMSAPPAESNSGGDLFANFSAQASGGGSADMFANMSNSTPQNEPTTMTSPPAVSSDAASAAADPFLAMSMGTAQISQPSSAGNDLTPASTPVAPTSGDPFAAMAAASQAEVAAPPSGSSQQPASSSDFDNIFMANSNTDNTTSASAAATLSPSTAMSSSDFDNIFSANSAAPPSASSAVASDAFSAFAGQPEQAPAPAAEEAESRERAQSKEDVFSTAFGGQSLFASSSGDLAATANTSNNQSSSWDPFTSGGGGGGSSTTAGGGGGSGLVDLGPDRSRVDPLAVAEGKQKGSKMWQKLQRLSAMAPAAALDVLEHGDDPAGKDAKAMSSIAAQNVQQAVGKEPDGGAARITWAIRQAEEGSAEALTKCRSLQDKRVALDAAVRLSNRDTILLVVLWLRETLKYDLFMDEISLRPRAVKIYAEYLRDTWRWEQLETFFVSVRAVEMVRYKDRPQLQRTDSCVELALCMVRRALSKEAPDEQIKVLKEVVDYSKTVPRGTLWETSQLEVVADWSKDWMELTRRQVEVEKNDSNAEKKAQATTERPTDLSNVSSEAAVPLFTRFPRRNVIGMSVLDLMQYLALYHANDKEDQISSPKGLKKALSISEKLFWFAAFSSLARVGLWDVIRRATESKSMFTTKTSDKSPIGWRPLLNLVFEYSDCLASPDLRRLATHFANHMEDRMEAYSLCFQKTLWEGAIQACVDLRDEDRLIDLRVRITEESGDVRPFIQMIDDVYKDTRIKWKTDLSHPAPTVLGSKTLAGITSMFKKNPQHEGKGGLSTLFSKKKKEETTSPSTRPYEDAHKKQVVFGGGPGGLVDDD
mmetsp:Transcript_42605/g.87074  ORF Transcript_42605/g.87074 Transcript_42605/m.87074 type:complete len:893 (+) Transcript_42605:174-2852(+)|eukprot:CAMPEP_0181302892 /NCGR_PEP_ID=MMETSP1101-20121128/8246_1 /TAXON_ID=46948 /ORGANISM="Rhodomonas abbreviata, Strain Caron Lab Isolate" /LENGTH=892 /DNA_ID=CAMNT_0023408387 /DNA_START=172 /DNA_END=2850 /DNA_ORIENTATION=-